MVVVQSRVFSLVFDITLPSLQLRLFKGSVYRSSCNIRQGARMDAKEKPYKFVVRLPTQLRNQIFDAAKYYRRSMNSEIVSRLEQTFSAHDRDTEVQEPRASQELETWFTRTLSTNEQKLLDGYRRLPAEKQSALLGLLD